MPSQEARVQLKGSLRKELPAQMGATQTGRVSNSQYPNLPISGAGSTGRCKSQMMAFVDRGKGYTFGGIMQLKDKASLDAYFQHPTHQALLAWLVPLIDAVELDLQA